MNFILCTEKLIIVSDENRVSNKNDQKVIRISLESQ